MKINMKLKILIRDFLKEISHKPQYVISYLPVKKEDKIYDIIEDYLSDECYFIYKDGNKYNSELLVVSKKDIKKYFNDNYEIYAIDTLDYLNVGYTCMQEKDEPMIEVYTSGKFNSLLDILKDNFEYNKEESRLPNHKVAPRLKE